MARRTEARNAGRGAVERRREMLARWSGGVAVKPPERSQKSGAGKGRRPPPAFCVCDCAPCCSGPAAAPSSRRPPPPFFTPCARFFFSLQSYRPGTKPRALMTGARRWTERKRRAWYSTMMRGGMEVWDR